MRIARDAETPERPAQAPAAPPPAGHAQLIALQRSAGNRAVNRLLARWPFDTHRRPWDPPPFYDDEPEWMDFAREHPPAPSTTQAPPQPATPQPATPQPATPQPAQGNCPARTMPAFPTQRYTIEHRIIGRLNRNADEVCNEVLQIAGADTHWYDNFTSGVTFLGQQISDPIHVRLAQHLWTVEQQFAQQFGGPNCDPAVAGQALGVTESIAGGRTFPTSASVSMHMFGLAIDINYTSNPYIAQSDRMRDAINAIFAEMNALMGTSHRYRHGMTYDQLSALNQTLLAYFALASDATALGTRLQAATAAPWRGLGAAAAARRIQGHRRSLSQEWSSTSNPAGRNTAIATTGFLNLNRDLVTGIGLDWGGTSYSDMMHFDMRNETRPRGQARSGRNDRTGAEIYSAIQTWKRQNGVAG